MNIASAHPNSAPIPGARNVASIVQWLRELEECRKGGLITDEEYAVERAEKLAVLLCAHRHLWLAWVTASSTCAAIVGSIAWARFFDWQVTGVVAALGALFGLVMFARPCRDAMKQAQIRDRMEVLHSLLAHDLVTSEEYLVYEERLQLGEGTVHTVVMR